jgi:hypothetical protein
MPEGKRERPSQGPQRFYPPLPASVPVYLSSQSLQEGAIGRPRERSHHCPAHKMHEALGRRRSFWKEYVHALVHPLPFPSLCPRLGTWLGA